MYDPAEKKVHCIFCDTSCPANRRSCVISHVESKKHQAQLVIHGIPDIRGVKLEYDEEDETTIDVVEDRLEAPLLFRGEPPIEPEVGEIPFAEDLCRLLRTWNVPLNKVEEPDFVRFLEKYAGAEVPNRLMLAKIMEEQGTEKEIRLQRSRAMENITEMKVAPLTESRFVKPLRLHYKQDDIPKVWDIIQCHASVAVVLFNITNQSLVFVRQFRPPVYFSALRRAQGQIEPGADINLCAANPKKGITLELCAGIVDKNKSLAEIAQGEILEECGYEVPIGNIQQIQTFPSSVGVGGESATLFYAETTSDMKKGKGGGVVEEGELIEVVEMSLTETKALMNQPEVNMPPMALYGLSWFFMNKMRLF